MNDLCMITDYIECLFVKLSTKDSSYVVGVVYRPPNSNITLFNDKMNDILSKLSNMPCYVMGDYNIDFMKYENHLQTGEFFNNMHSNSLIPLIYKPTRETKTAATLIDNIFTNNYNVNDLLLQGLLITDISDHYAIFQIWDKHCLETDQYELIRLTNESRVVKYKENISSIDWTVLDQYNSCEVYFTHFFNKIKSVYDESFPITKVKKRYRNRIPWLTSGLRESIKHKNKLYRMSLIHPTAYNETLYKQYRNMTTRLLRIEEKQYYQSQIEANRDNIRKTWMVIKQAINRKRASTGSDKFYHTDSNSGITSDPAVIANAFNNFFVNIGPTLSSKIPEQGLEYRKYMPQGNEYSLFLLLTTDQEVNNIIKQLKDGAPGKDGITSLSLKLVSDFIVKPITRTVNLSFSQGVFPNELKIALVSPLYKAKDPMYFSNYWPISLLSTFSKILERLMYNRILDFPNKNKILNKYQFGFRTNHSTYMALIILLENIMKALENGESAIGIFLDFQKAFDTVNHSILLDKLCIYGIRGPALSWITSYLSNRYQYVVYNGYESECKYISCGVPQGSILGPLLFLLCINDLPAVSKLFMPILFAADKNLFCTSHNVNMLVDDINTELVNVYAWVQSNKLSLNIDKTNYMLFSPKCACRPAKNIIIHGQSIVEVNESFLEWSSIIDLNGLLTWDISQTKFPNVSV